MRVSAATKNSDSGSEGGNMTQTILSTRQPRKVRGSKNARSKEGSLPHVQRSFLVHHQHKSSG